MHTITEYPELEGTCKDQQVQLLALHRASPRVTTCALRALSALVLWETVLAHNHLLGEVFSKPPLTQVQAVALGPSTGHHREEKHLH